MDSFARFDMTDLTSTLSSLLTATHTSKSIVPHSTDSRTLDSFLLEARQINTSIRSLLIYLRALRGPYLSTSPVPSKSRRTHLSTASTSHSVSTITTPLGPIPAYLTNSQRESIDNHTSDLLRDLTNNITNLRNAATLAHETARQRLERKHGGSKRKNLLFRWAAGGDSTDKSKDGDAERRTQEEGIEETRREFRDGVLWYLNDKLRIAVTAQQEMVAIRLEREREKRASILYDQANRGVKLLQPQDNTSTEQATQSASSSSSTSALSTQDMQSHDLYDPSLDQSYTTVDRDATQPTQSQLHLFAEENSTLLNHYTSQLPQITRAESSLLEISALQQTLLSHLGTQSEMIEHLVADAENTDQDVNKGNKELKRASERGSTARWVYYATLWICGGLVVWDLIF